MSINTLNCTDCGKHLEDCLCTEQTINPLNRRTVIRVELNETQQERFDNWINHIKALYGQVGLLTWKYTSNGIGMELSVFSDLAKVELDLTDVDSW